MPLFEIELADMDTPATAQSDPALTFTVDAEPEMFRRWRPAVIVGDYARPFIDSYFAPLAPMPWAGLISVTNGTVLDQGLVLSGNRLLCGHSLMYPLSAFPYAHSPLQFVPTAPGRWSVELPQNVVHLPGVTASLFCDGWKIYGHWLVDVLPRLNRILNSRRAIDTFLFPGPPTAWQLAMLAAVGLDTARCRFVDFSTTLVRCDQLIISTYDRFNSEIRPDLIKIHEMLRSKSDGPPESGRMIFISRPPGSSRSLLNRDAVEAAASKLGYEIVRPERLLFSEQIKLFASARVVLGECGSGMHNTLYCAPGTRVGVVQSATNQNFLQAQIALMKQQDIFYVIGKPDEQIEHAFSVEIQDVRNVAEMMKAP